MSRLSFRILLVGLFVLAAGWVSAQPTNQAEAQAELEKLERVHAFARETVVPLINCYVQNQPYLQSMYGNLPERGRERVRTMDACAKKYTGTVEDAPKLVAIRDQALVIMKRDIELGNRYCDAWTEFNRLNASKARDSVLEDSKRGIESMKQELFKNASDFAKVQSDFREWQTNFNEYFAKVRNMALGRK